MKKLIAITFSVAVLAQAGPLKVATYPVVHPKKDVHAAKKVAKGGFKAVKAIVR